MTLLDWVVARVRDAMGTTERPAPLTATLPRAATQELRVPAKYRSLHTYLDHRYAETVVLSFDQMEALLGSALPGPARTEGRWWTDASTPEDPHADTWTMAHRSATPNLPAGNVVFVRIP